MSFLNNIVQNPTILLVDDNEEILEFISSDLKDYYTVLNACNGLEALKIITAQTVHLIISDVMMPVMDGFELCQSIKSNILTSHIPVILLTAKNTLKSKIEGLALGADAYIDKPFSPEHLQVQIANLLANRIKIKEYIANSPLIHIKSIACSKEDEHFLEELNKIINIHIKDPELDVIQLAKYMNLSRPTLYRKIKAISDLTPTELINITRLKKGAFLLTEGHYNINEVALMVGYTSSTHFGRNFLKQFGVTASEFVKEK